MIWIHVQVFDYYCIDLILSENQMIWIHVQVFDYYCIDFKHNCQDSDTDLNILRFYDTAKQK
jgi:hypothetical protein